MADLIERGAAIDKMCGDCKSGYDGRCPHPQGMCHECESIWQTPKVDISTVNSWIPCTKRMPDTPIQGLGALYSDCCLVCSVETEWAGMAYYVKDDEGSYWEFADAQNKPKIDWAEITHWMPMPELPKEVHQDD